MKKTKKITYKHGDMYQGSLTLPVLEYEGGKRLKDYGLKDGDLVVRVSGDEFLGLYPIGGVVRIVRDDGTRSPYFGHFVSTNPTKNNGEYNSCYMDWFAKLPSSDYVETKQSEFEVSYTARDGTVYKKDSISAKDPACRDLVQKTLTELEGYRAQHLKHAREISKKLSTHAKLFKIRKPRKRVKKAIKPNPKKK